MCSTTHLYFYQSKGTLKCPPNVKFGIFERECRFFELPDAIINKLKTDEGIIYDLDDDDKEIDNPSFKMRIWNVVENPGTGRTAWFFGMFSCSMIIVSVITHILETMRTPLREEEETEKHEKKHGTLHSVEFVINGWFLAEFVVRAIFSPSKQYFAKGIMNWVDLFSVLPYFVVLIIEVKALGALGVLRTLKFLRVLRLFRLSKHSRRLKVVAIILKSSFGNLKLLFICLTMVILLGAILIYYLESMETHEVLNSIPECLWWGVQTITSVGYGDLIPKTILGRLFSCSFMIFGALTISFPVLSIVSHFAVIYPKNVDIQEYVIPGK